ncbi:MAG: tRNA/rRNA methyltransferase (SpoU) [Solirubrobacterales bacterium]|jgi:TrmH family RNA methyltransferase|nr:tRNA/rRNA methyltransferase (SpoU) [Solirubrobacterales bacterium]
MITSKDNEKLKLIRRLGERKHRRREGLFVAEGEDLVAAAEAAGAPAVFVLRAGTDVEAGLLDSVTTLGSGTRVIGVYQRIEGAGGDRFCVYLHRVRDPGNVGAIIRIAHALLDAPVLLGPGCADPFGPKAVRASMGSIFAQPPMLGGVAELAPPIVGLVAHGGEPLDDGPVGALALGAEREGLPAEIVERCDRLWTIPLAKGGAESLNVAAAAAIALGRISSAAPADDLGGPS